MSEHEPIAPEQPVREPEQPRYSWMNPHPLAGTAYFMAALTFCCLPIVTGPVGIVLGILAARRGDPKNGITAAAACLICGSAAVVMSGVTMCEAWEEPGEAAQPRDALPDPNAAPELTPPASKADREAPAPSDS